MSTPDEPTVHGNASEEAFYFENEGLRLFAVLHRAGIQGPRRGVVLCHPYGEEQQVSYRILVRFARELCGRGFDVLRFDCRGYGDSQGDFEAANLQTQVDDALTAIDVLKAQTGIELVDVLGVRLGATVAALAASRTRSVGRLIFWSPIVNGGEYVGELIKHKVLADITSGRTPVSGEQLRRELQTAGAIELGGFRLTNDVYRQLHETDLTSQDDGFRGDVLILARLQERRRAQALRQTYEARGCRCEIKVVDSDAFWDFPSLWEWSFPDEVFQATLGWMVNR